MSTFFLHNSEIYGYQFDPAIMTLSPNNVITFNPNLGGNFLPLAGGTLTGGLTGTTGAFTVSAALGNNTLVTNFLMTLNGAATGARKFQWQTAGVGRWDLGVSTGAESGANAGADLVIQRRSDAGSILDAPLTISRATGLASWVHGSSYNLGTVTLSGAITADQQPTSVQVNYAGVNNVDTEVDYNRWLVNSDTAQLLGSTTAFTGLFSSKPQTGFTGSRIGLGSTMNVLGTSGNQAAGTVNPFYISLWGNMTGTANQGGSSTAVGSSYGAVWAGLYNIALTSTATNYANMTGVEIDVNNQGTATRKHGFQVSLGAADVNRGAVFDAAIVMGNGSGSAGSWKNGLLLGEDSSQWPFASDSTMIGALMGQNDQTVPAVADLGVDLQDVTFGTAAFRSNGFSVDNTGNVQIGAAYLKPTSAGLTVDTVGAIGNTANGGGMIVSGGTGWAANGQILTDPYGGRYKTTSVSGGVITGLTVYRQPRFPSTITPANPVTLTGRSGAAGASPTINITWNTTATTLALQPTGGATSHGGAVSAAGALTATGAGVGLAVTNNATVGGTLGVTGTLTLGAGGAGGQNITASGTGNLIFTNGGSSSLFNFKASGGTSILQLGGSTNTVNVQTQLILPATKVWAGASIGANASLFCNSTWTGAPGGNITAALNQLQMTEGIDVGATGGVVGFVAQLNAATAGFTGNRQAGNFILNISAAPTGAGVTYSALNTKVIGQVNVGGTGTTVGTSAGAVFGLNPVATLLSAATNWTQLVGTEINTQAQVGSSVVDKIGLQVVDVTGSVVQGARDDVALSLNNQYAPSGSTGFKVGLSFGRAGGFMPVSTTGTLIGGQGNLGAAFTVDKGIDWSLGTATTKWLDFGGVFKIAGNGVPTLPAFTVATLPAAATAGAGAIAYVTDATAPTYRGALVGGGAVKTLVMSDGAAWTSH